MPNPPNPAQQEPAGGSSAAGRIIVAGFAVVVVVVVGYFVLGMPGMDMGEGGAASHRMSGMRSDSRASRTLGVDAFARELQSRDAFVINVHVPYGGELAGTDAFIPFDRVVGDPRDPADRGVRILLYCRTGRMSAIAAASLVADGYTNVAELRGGMDAWEADGRRRLVVAGR